MRRSGGGGQEVPDSLCGEDGARSMRAGVRGGIVPYGKGLQIARSIGLREGTICANIYGLGGRQGSGKRLTCLVGMEYTYGQVGKGWVRVESQGVEEPDVLAGNMSHSH